MNDGSDSGTLDVPRGWALVALMAGTALVGAMSLMIGSWFWVIGLAALVGGGLAYLSYRAGARRHAELLARLGPRETIPVSRQAKDLLISRGLHISERAVHSIAIHWADVGRVLQIDPGLLRATDELARDYNPDGMWADAAFIGDAFGATAGTSAVQKKLMVEAGSLGGTLCRRCRYDLRGLAPDARCPECGAARISIRTLGDYVLLVSGVTTLDG
jgi:hypothetical protein